MDNEIKDEQTQETVNEETTNKDEAVTSDETKNTEEQEQQVDNRIPYDRFKSKVDEVNALKEKLGQIEREQEEANRKKLEEQNEYKQLYEQAKETIEQQKEDALNAKKTSLLSQAGYNEEQIIKLSKLVDGEDDEAIKRSIEELKTTFPTKKYVDPSLGNNQRGKPAKTDGEELGRNMFESLFKSGRIKGIKKQ